MRTATLVTCALSLLACPLPGATLTVNLEGGADYTDIQSAIDAAADGDTVLVQPGEYVIAEPINFNGKPITVKSEGGAEVTTVRRASDAGVEGAVFSFTSGETGGSALEGFKVSGGANGGVYCFVSSPTLTHCTISGNYGGGLYCYGSSPTLTNCTISGNSGGGVFCDEGFNSTVTSCILWDNAGGSLKVSGVSQPQVSFSCVEAERIWPGTGNTNADPLFCGWGEKGEVWLDPSIPGPGDGSEGNPFSDTRDATAGYSLALSTGSPCLGTGKDGSNMGADTGTCGGLPGSARIVHMPRGTYAAADLELAHTLSLVGAGRDSTVIEGTVYGLRTGALLSNLTVTKGSGGGIVVSAGESPTLSDCTISGNSAGWGGGVSCSQSSPTLTNCTISGNSAWGYGGGLYCDRSSPTLANCTISGNSAWEGGGGVYCGEGSSPTLTSSILWDNVGGSLSASGDLQPSVSFSCLETPTVWPGEGNINADPLFCGWGGQAEVWVDPSRPGPGDGSEGNPFSNTRDATVGYSLALSTGSPCLGTGKDGADMGAEAGTCGVPGGRAPIVHLAAGTYPAEDLDLAHGASLLGSGEGTTVLRGTVDGLRTGATISNLTVIGGTRGGIVVGRKESPEITACTISGSSGPGVDCGEWSSPTLTSCTISANAGDGVRCSWGSSAKLRGSTFSGNQGCGVYCNACDRGYPTVTGCTISGNGRGGVYCQASSPSLTNCTISGNSAGGGGGMYCAEGSSPTLTNCTISRNSATVDCGPWPRCWAVGGGMYCAEGSSPTLSNCTISGNSADSGDGGGVFCEDGSSPTLTNCTISGNSATVGCSTMGCHGGLGGGMYCAEGSSPTLTNCIVWGNAPDSVCGALTNCLTDQDPLFVRPGAWVDCPSPQDPLCIAYQWDASTGEPTAWHRWDFDYHLQPGSPAIDTGTTEGAPTTDIEGHGRPCGAGVDIGAYEYGECALSTERFQRGEANADGKLDISDPVATLGFLFLGSEDLPCLDAADVDDSGTVNITDAVYSLNFLLLGGPEPPSPFPDCGIDPRIDGLDCKAHAGCS